MYCGLGSRKLSKAEFAEGLEMVVGPNRAYSTKPTMRRVNQQLDHFDEILSKPLSYESLGKTLARFGGRGTPRTPAA